MKKIILILTLVSVFSCNQQELGSNLSVDEIKGDLADISLLIPAIEAGLELSNGVSASEVDARSNRTFSPIAVSESQDTVMTEYFGADWSDDDGLTIEAPYTPSEVFTNKADEVVGGELRIPSTGYITGLNGDDELEFYLILEEISTAKYRVSLYKYPGDIFNIDYIYEEYVVDENSADASWAWDWFSSRGNRNQYTENRTYYRDGTYSDRTIDWIGSDLQLDLVVEESPGYGTSEPLNYSVDNMLTDIDLYEYPAVEPIYTDDTSVADYSSISDIVVAGTSNRLIGSEFYSENGNSSYSVLYLEGKKRKDDRRSVTRYYQDRDLDAVNILAMNTNGDDYTEINRVRKYGDLYQSWRHVWSVSPSSTLDTDVATSYITDLDRESGSDIYSGTLTIYSGSSGDVYDYSIDSSTGEITMVWTNSVTRTLSNTTIDLNDLENITISGGNWSFTASYEMSELSGTYSYLGTDYVVNIDLEGIEVNGVFEKW